MVTFDPTPYWRSTVGFDHLFDLLANATLPQAQETYPPYNIARSDEDNYRISLAVAGFTPEEIAITAEQNQLTVEGQKRAQQNAQYLYQGISARAFRRTFNLADHVKVKGASFEHGLLPRSAVDPERRRRLPGYGPASTVEEARRMMERSAVDCPILASCWRTRCT